MRQAGQSPLGSRFLMSYGLHRRLRQTRYDAPIHRAANSERVRHQALVEIQKIVPFRPFMSCVV